MASPVSLPEYPLATSMLSWLEDHWFQLGVLAGFLILFLHLAGIRSALHSIDAKLSRVDSYPDGLYQTIRKIDERFEQSGSVGFALNLLLRHSENANENIEHIIEKLAPELEVKRRRIELRQDELHAKFEEHLANLRERAEDGNLSSVLLYAKDLEKKEDHVQAYTWVQIAANLDPYPHEARQHCKRVAANMTPEQISEAEARVREWLNERRP